VIELEPNISHGARICVIGVGGGGGNAINSMVNRGVNGVEFIAANTDVQALQHNFAPIKIQLGKNCTRGLGAGADPMVGHKSVEESADEIKEVISGADMVFVTAGMGGGTGTGAAPTVAKIARELGALVVGIVTKPFKWEAGKRASVAERGVEELRKNVDALIVIPNQRLMSVIDKHTSFREAFQRVDEVLCNATRGIADIISGTGYINVDFADVRTIMKNTGDALMGTGFAKGEHRAVEAAQAAIASPLLDGVSIQGAQGVLVNITGSGDMTMHEISDAVSVIEQAAGGEVNLIHGIVFDEAMGDSVMVTVVATGFGQGQAVAHAKQASTSERNGAATGELYASNGNGTVRIDTTVEKLAQEVATPAATTSATSPTQPSAQPATVGTISIVQAPVHTPTPTRVIPASSPSGLQELQKYDEPAFKRRLGANSIRLNRLDGDGASEDIPNDEQASKPAFLRRIMD
jgi:cell division protein FtsZ